MSQEKQKKAQSFSQNLDKESQLEEDLKVDFFQGLSGRRKKAAFVLILIWISTILLYKISWGMNLILGFWFIFLIQSFRVVFAKPKAIPSVSNQENLNDLPFFSLLVSAKNEETVINKLVKILCNLDYPQNKYEVWVIDDYSSDRTGEILDQLALEYSQLQVLHRPANAGGGKCGALNDVTPLTKGDIIGVFDADAQISPDLLKNIVAFFTDDKIGAVQTRKAINNPDVNFWTKGQTVEMILDSYYQQQRIAIGGLGELRGNGQFVRRKALDRCGGWNEETITDDLDLTIRLHLDNWEIGFLLNPPVYEEGVTNIKALWHQRNRWGEGGYQRYLDYWRLILRHPLGLKKRLDLIFFMFLQYILPTAIIPDFLMAIITHRLPMLGLLNGTIVIFSFIGMISGFNRPSGVKSSFFKQISQGILGTIYMIHWLIIMPSITARMSIRPKRLKWVKTIHQGLPVTN
jgi:1,2-diacylglycerol 3-beta-glucosyltransferase